VAAQLTHLPYLSTLRLNVGHCDPESKRILSGSDSLAWVSISEEQGWDIQAYRAQLAPERSPPVDPLPGTLFDSAWGQ
jgi:hypothetical protein